MKDQLESLLRIALTRVPDKFFPAPPDAAAAVVERARDSRHGDFASNIAMRLAKAAGRAPREIATAILDALPPNELIERTEIAGAGFINFFLARGAWSAQLAAILDQADRYGQNQTGAGIKVLVEFVSANPTGPLHVGHGRQAAYGATLANLLEACGYTVGREYYINDAGRQMEILAVSVWIRAIELGGQTLPFPSNGYRGEYVRAIAQKLRVTAGAKFDRPAAQIGSGLPPDAPEGDKEIHIDALIARMREQLGTDGFREVQDISLQMMLDDIRADLAEFGVTFDRWYSERALEESGAIDRALQRLEQQGHLYRKDGALWFRATTFGDDEDRVVVRENGVRTYFSSDIAYHLDKRERGFDELIDVLGADHHGYIARVRGGLAALGEPGDCLEVPLIQFVSLFRAGVKVPMGKREAQFVTLRDLRQEVGNDACRLFYLMRSHEQPLDFDLELAKSRTNENPVYYIQYAHARVASVMKQLASRELSFDRASGLAHAERLDGVHEQAVLAALTNYPQTIRLATQARSPHMLVHALRELANTFHTYYNAEQFIVADSALRNARLALILAVQQVIRNGLTLLGVSAPETM